MAEGRDIVTVTVVLGMLVLFSLIWSYVVGKADVSCSEEICWTLMLLIGLMARPLVVVMCLVSAFSMDII